MLTHLQKHAQIYALCWTSWKNGCIVQQTVSDSTVRIGITGQMGEFWCSTVSQGMERLLFARKLYMRAVLKDGFQTLLMFFVLT